MKRASRRGRHRLPLFFLLGLVLAAGPLLLHAQPASAATITVITTGDNPDLNPSDGVCDTSSGPGAPCSLRAAIETANAIAGADVIAFAIPGVGVQSIQPGSQLPDITDPVTIDGYTQPGSSANTATTGTNAVPRIVLDGTNAGIVDGLHVTTADDTVIRGLVVNRFGQDGIDIGAAASSVRITGCFVGTNAAGVVGLGNGDDGIDTRGSNTVVGTAAPADRNLISANANEGIRLEDTAEGSRVVNNLIGTDETGAAALGNLDHGVNTNVADAFIGGDAPEEANVIAFNGTDGVVVQRQGARNRILGNSIFANGEQGIDLGDDGVTANDAGDADTDANTRQNFPVITTATTTGVEGTLNSKPNRTISLRLFSNPGVQDEGKVFEDGPLVVTTDANGDAIFAFAPNPSIPVGRSVTVTATNNAGNTSEFSAAVVVTS